MKHRLHPDARTRRIPFHRQYRSVLDFFLPRFHSKVERSFDELTGWRQRRPLLTSASSRTSGHLRLHPRANIMHALLQYVRRTGLIAHEGVQHDIIYRKKSDRDSEAPSVGEKARRSDLRRS